MAIKSVRIQFDKLMGETPRAYLLRFHNQQFWFPRRFCWKMVVNNKLGGNVAIPTWLYKEKFGEAPGVEIADTIVEKHVPNKIDPISNSQPHKNLLK